MSLARYFLLRAGDNWLVTLEGQIMARCATRTEAVQSAIVMADLMGAMHHDADVMLETEAGKPLELVWTYGKDKLPKARRRAATKAEPAPHHVHLVQRGEAA